MTNDRKKRKLIFITGPEASGKTLLAEAISKKLNCPWVPEYARAYLTELQRPYQKEDIIEIGRLQWEIQQDVLLTNSSPFVICDTGFLVLKIWMEFRYNEIDPWIEEQFLRVPADLYLLCKPDIPWAPDPLREHPYQREELYELYLKALQDYEKPYVIIEGEDYEQRLEQAIQSLKAL